MARLTVSSGATEPGRPRHDRSARGGSAAAEPNASRKTASRLGERAAEHRRRGLRCPPPPSAAASAAASSSGVLLRVTQKTRSSISTSSTSARVSVRSTSLCARFETPSTCRGPGDRGDEEHLDAGDSTLSSDSISASSSSRSSSPSGVCRKVASQLLSRAVAQAPGERVGVALRRGRIGERAGVLVDAERERGRLERRRLELALGEDADERRRQRAVLREHDAFSG